MSRSRSGSVGYSEPGRRTGRLGSCSSSGSSNNIEQLGRKTSEVMEVVVSGGNLRLDVFGMGQQYAMRVALSVRKLEVHDGLESSPFNKFLCQHHPERNQQPMVTFEMCTVRPDPSHVLEEYRLKLNILPLRLNVDQDAVEFLIGFFTGRDINPIEAAPVKPVYIQSFETGALRLCVDYKPNRVDFKGLQEGDYAQILHLFPLEGVEIEMKAVKLNGVEGWDRVLSEAGQIWALDIGKHQAHHYLAGVQPIRSFVNVGSGVVDLLLMPLATYRRHGRLVPGLRQGASSFVKSVSLETMSVTSRVAQGAHAILESVDRTLSGQPVQPSTRPKPAPVGFQEGMLQAYESLARGLRYAVHGIVVVPQEEFHRVGYTQAAISVLQAVPSFLLKPMIGATEAITTALAGATNTMDPSKKKELEDKYKHKSLR